tara:strand:+ start:1129 stop:2418 length:1290 start_codon:yes stop_codon:yes gene_type:complete
MSFSEPRKRTQETQKLYDHLQWLFKNPIYMETVHKRRMQVAMRILKKLRKIKEDYQGFHTSDYQALFETYQWFSYFMSQDWTDVHAYQYQKQTGAKKPWSLFYYIVHCLIKSDSFKWVAPNGEAMHAFHTNGKQDTYFHCEWDEHTVQTMAAAAQDEGKAWTSQLWLARKMVTVYDKGKFIPLERFVPISMTECWQPGVYVQDEELNEDREKPAKQPDLWYYHPKQQNKIELFKTVISDVYNDLECNKWLYGEGLGGLIDPIEVRNIIIVIMLLEHELIHAYIAREDQSENLDITEKDELAIPASFPRYQWMKYSEGARPRNLRVPLDVWPANRWIENFVDKKGNVKDPGWASRTVAPAYTNSAGHGDYFCRFTNMIFGHCGCTSSTDTVKFASKCVKKTWCIRFENLVGSSTDGDVKMGGQYKLKLVF